MLFFFATFCFLRDFIRIREARTLIRELQTLEVGRSTGEQALRAVARFEPKAYVVKESNENATYTTTFIDVPLQQCATEDCEISVTRSFELLPRSVANLILDSPRIRRWAPYTTVSVNLSVKRGILREVSAFITSVLEDRVTEVRSTLDNEKRLMPWNIHESHAHNTGGFLGARTTERFDVEFTPEAPEQRKRWAFEFDFSCLRTGRHCSECELAPKICNDYKTGEWNYFELKGPLLEEFKNAVNNLPFGSSEKEVVNRLGESKDWQIPGYGVVGRTAGLPLAFPSGTVWGGQQSLNYVLRKHRDMDTEPYESQVTLRFTCDHHLVAVESTVPGIFSRSKPSSECRVGSNITK